jgi:ribosomal protein S18 acetylase RimI-like enzyme
MIIETDESKQVGLVQVDQINWVSRNGWFGIWVVKNQRRKGYGEVSIKAIINYSFATLGLRQLRLVVKADNSAAIGLYETIGFTQEGVMRDAEFLEGKFHDLVIMGLNKL